MSSIQSNYSSSTGLLPDFIMGVPGSPEPAYGGFFEGSHDGDYHQNACRVPWRIGTDYLVSGDSRARSAAKLHREARFRQRFIR